MENFSTSRAALLPRVANLATLAVVVAATWWSGEQRPAPQPALAAADITAAATAAQPSQQDTEPSATSTVVAHWPAQATALRRDGLQAVGFQARTQR